MISVIIPVYNVDRYLGECLDSVLAQTVKELEVILVDDGSTDRSGEICDMYAERDARVKVIHQPNSGRSAARNAALAAASGEYVGFVDSDDWIEPRMYETLLNALERTGADLAICGYWFEYTWGRRVKQPMLPASTLPRDRAIELLVEDRYIQSLSCDKLFRREVLQARYPEGRATYEDSAVMLSWFSNLHEVVICPEPMYHYRMRMSGVVNTREPEPYFDKFTADIGRAEFLATNFPSLFSEEQHASTIVESGIMAAKKMARYCRKSQQRENLMRQIAAELPKYYDRAGDTLRGKTRRRYKQLVSSLPGFIIREKLKFFLEFSNRRKSGGCFE